MSKYSSDCYGVLHDHNGRIGTSDESGLTYAVRILNQQDEHIASLLTTIRISAEQRADESLAAEERIAKLILDRDVTIQFREEAEKRVKQLTADLSKPPQERIHCKGCSLPDEKQGLKQQNAALKDNVERAEVQLRKVIKLLDSARELIVTLKEKNKRLNNILVPFMKSENWGHGLKQAVIGKIPVPNVKDWEERPTDEDYYLAIGKEVKDEQ